MVNQNATQEVYKRLIINLFGHQGPCCLCGAGAPVDEGICNVCRNAMPALRPPLCRCGLPCPGHDEIPQEDSICGKCLSDIPPFSSVNAIFSYKYPLSPVLRHYKHRRDIRLERALASLWSGALMDRLDHRPDALVPVPCHWRRRWSRGFSPAERLAAGLGKHLGLPVLEALRRPGSTPSQQGRGRGARRKNLRGSMRLQEDVTGLHLALVDDVMTTGATAREATHRLLRGGAARVDVWVLARTL